MDTDVARQVRAQGLRIAFAVAVGFTAAVAWGSALPFLLPLFAAQFLLASPRPLARGPALVTIGVILVAGQALALLTALLGNHPAALLLLLGLIYVGCFLAQARGKGGAAVFLVLVIAIVAPLLGILKIELGEAIGLLLLKAVAGAILLSWLAHALFPGGSRPTAPVAERALPARPLRRALANAVILLGAVLLCLVNERFSTALVVPITVATLLGQIDLASSRRKLLGLLLVNLLGGLVASLAFPLLQLQPTLPLLFCILLAVGLVFAGQAVSDMSKAPIYGGALTIFLILFGLGVSPLPTSAGDSFTTRIGYLLVAMLYTVCAVGLFWTAGTARPDRTEASPAS